MPKQAASNAGLEFEKGNVYNAAELMKACIALSAESGHHMSCVEVKKKLYINETEL